MFKKERLLDIVKNFICFSNEGINSFKILAGYHQYFAVRKAIESTKHATVTDGKGGVFWHTQGSGKSLSMVFYAHLLQEALDSPTIVVITDRNDLDDQLYGQFAKCKEFLRQEPVHAESRENLKSLLAGRQANGIIFTTMQKFEESHEALSERNNIIVMADEAHRGQYGLTETVDAKTGKIKIGTARIIRNTLPNATYIGFTGTPISSKDRSTREVFGDYIDILKQSIKSDGVINLFSDIKEEFSLFDPKFLEEVASMKEKNLAVELLKKLIAEQVSVYRRTNVVKSEKFSEIMQRSLNAYLNGMLTNEEVIEEMLNLAKQIAAAKKEGDQLGLTADELAFYDALTKPQAIKDFYENEELIAITKELADTLRRNKTIDWQKRESARAKMRMLIKKLLKKHKYPPEGMEDAVQTVMTQCELWTDNNDMGEEKVVNFRDKSISYAEANYAPMKVAESTATYGAKK